MLDLETQINTKFWCFFNGFFRCADALGFSDELFYGFVFLGNRLSSTDGLEPGR